MYIKKGMHINREQIYVEFRKKVESDKHYFDYGQYGTIEEILVYFGLASKEFKGIIHTSIFNK